ncbi:DUF2087 domain-containing protein [Cochlodiniinecator piscidefendens]|uniref:DUF2087 domain-containing protein n=1 Tax=Cochlodiniinecator piscidefendens TaxID=2715756 RepID=UPI00140B55C5|nr:DUF2087 domain-containing protein [Cochlodiniinecator piscidefendens]
MSKDPISLFAPDISRFARNVSQQLKEHDGPPSHLSLLNMLARGAGFRNYQHMKASHSAQMRLNDEKPDENVDHRLIERCLQHFDDGKMIRWPSRRPVQELCLWALWSDFPSALSLHEREVNARLNQLHSFGDAPLLRRSLVGLKLLSRNLDGSDYQRQEMRPPADALELIKKITNQRLDREE